MNCREKLLPWKWVPLFNFRIQLHPKPRFHFVHIFAKTVCHVAPVSRAAKQIVAIDALGHANRKILHRFKDVTTIARRQITSWKYSMWKKAVFDYGEVLNCRWGLHHLSQRAKLPAAVARSAEAVRLIERLGEFTQAPKMRSRMTRERILGLVYFASGSTDSLSS